jgi:hypothetical protein
MEDDEDFDCEHPDLPPEAGVHTPKGFEPNDEWLAEAAPRLRREAMRLWFLSRYCDPVHDTPYNGEEGGYLFIHGGPYTAEDELYHRFGGGGISDDEELRAVIDDVESEGIDEWAPIQHEREDEYDEQFALIVKTGSEPLKRLPERLRQAREVMTLEGSAEAKGLAQLIPYT